VFVVNKADREGADAAVRDLEQMLRMGPRLPWVPPVVKTAAAVPDGIEDLWMAMSSHRDQLEASGRLTEDRRARLLREVESLTVEELRDRVRAALSGDAALTEDLVERRIDPYAAAAAMIDRAAAAPEAAP